MRCCHHCLLALSPQRTGVERELVNHLYKCFRGPLELVVPWRRRPGRTCSRAGIVIARRCWWLWRCVPACKVYKKSDTTFDNELNAPWCLFVLQQPTLQAPRASAATPISAATAGPAGICRGHRVHARALARRLGPVVPARQYAQSVAIRLHEQGCRLGGSAAQLPLRPLLVLRPPTARAASERASPPSVPSPAEVGMAARALRSPYSISGQRPAALYQGSQAGSLHRRIAEYAGVWV